MKHALILGASGIVGNKLVQEFLVAGGWKITGVARRECPKEFQNQPGLNWISCDITEKSSCDNLFNKLDDVTHVFYVLWKQEEDDNRNVETNITMFRNILNKVGDSPRLQHFYLQTGTKYYGMHVGPEKGYFVPSKEDDPRLNIPNFYYDLEDELTKAAQGKQWSFAIGRPPCIIGLTYHTKMNFATSLAAYALVLKELGKPLIYPYSVSSFKTIREFVDSKLLAYFAAWTGMDGKKLNKAFNINNGDYVTMETLWPKIAHYFDMDYEVSPGAFNINDFLKDQGKVWNNIVQKNQLDQHNLDELITGDFLHQVLSREWPDLSITHRARSHGFHKTEDTEAMLCTFFDELQLKNVIPKLKGIPVEDLTQIKPKRIQEVAK